MLPGLTHSIVSFLPRENTWLFVMVGIWGRLLSPGCAHLLWSFTLLPLLTAQSPKPNSCLVSAAGAAAGVCSEKHLSSDHPFFLLSLPNGPFSPRKLLFECCFLVVFYKIKTQITFFPVFWRVFLLPSPSL